MRLVLNYGWNKWGNSELSGPCGVFEAVWAALGFIFIPVKRHLYVDTTCLLNSKLRYHTNIG